MVNKLGARTEAYREIGGSIALLLEKMLLCRWQWKGTKKVGNKKHWINEKGPFGQGVKKKKKALKLFSYKLMNIKISSVS